MNKKFTLVAIFAGVALFSQSESCEKPKDDIFEDLNSITSTKCTIKPSNKAEDKKSRQIKVRVSVSRRRYLKKTANPKRSSANSLDVLSTSGAILQNNSLKVKDNLISITNTLSKEEVRKAYKFSFVEKIPTFKKCKGFLGEKRLDCFNQEMINHINKNFHYPSEAIRDQIEGEVWVRFVIDSQGRVTNIKTMGQDGAEILDNEAKRVVSKLPFFDPGEIKGKPVSVKYGFPINFSLEQ